jgi:hypothetical protein
MKDQHDQQPEVEAVAVVEGEELQQLLRFECISFGGIDNAKKTLTLVNRCDRCMAARSESHAPRASPRLPIHSLAPSPSPSPPPY